MLHTDPVPRIDGDRFARVFRRRPSIDATDPSGRPYVTEAFHWGSLTTGHWLTSLWILLAPFALANVAGWMAARRSPLQRSAIRLAGLALTALFVAQLGYVVVGVPGLFAEANGWGETAMTWLRAGSGLGYVLLFGALVLRLSTQSHFDPLTYRERFALLFSPKVASMSQRGDDEPSWDDPAAAKITEPAMWKVHTILHRLRRIHFATGQLVVALVLARISGPETIKVVAVVGLAAMLALIIATSYRAENRLVLVTTAWSTLFAEATALWSVLEFAFDGGVLDLSAVHRTTFHIAIALGVAGGLSVLGGIPGVGVLTFATFFGGALGVGGGLIAEDLLSVEDSLLSQGGAWVAPASLIFVLFVVLVGVMLTYSGRPGLKNEGLANRLLTRLTRKSRILLAGSAGFGLIAGAFAIIEGCIRTQGLCQPDALTDLPGADIAVLVLLAGIVIALAYRLMPFRRVISGVLILVAAAVVSIGVANPAIGSFAPADYLKALPLSRTLIFVAPVAAIGRSVLGAYRQGASSRKVGVLWDVASFWPRWFHPLAPPAYGPKVVTALRNRLVNGEVNILAGHSQGSVIAAVATYQAIGAGGSLPSGLLTYGSPIGLLYGKLFPDTGMDELADQLPGRLDKGWSNLLREDDPIGGEPPGGNVIAVPEADGSGHSGYELTKTYRETRDSLT